MMSFGLENGGATYQCFMDQILLNRGKELRETFWDMRKHNMRLNLTKCVFGIRSGKFMGFMVSQRGIDADPIEVQAVLNLVEPKSKKNVMRLIWRMPAFSKSIAKSAEKSLPYFKVLRAIKTSFGKKKKRKILKT